MGLIRDEVRGLTVFLDKRRPNPRAGVHVIFSGERLRTHDLLPLPDASEAVRSASGFMVIDLTCLVHMKLDAFRGIDRVHLRDLIAVGLLNDRMKSELPRELRNRLHEIESSR